MIIDIQFVMLGDGSGGDAGGGGGGGGVQSDFCVKLDLGHVKLSFQFWF